MLKFNELPLNPTILKNLEEKGYESPTPIQAQSIPALLEGHDLLGIAQTGTGKTAAFSLPIINYLSQHPKKHIPMQPRVLILAPTRELASQIKDQIAIYSKNIHFKTAVIFGGVGQSPQVATLKNGVDILVATPGRLLDLMNQGLCKLNSIEVFVLDEADRMLDMGFIHDVKKVIAALPEKRQTLLFSATMPDEIVKISHRILKNPKRVEVTPPSSTVERIDQRVILCRKTEKYQLLRKLISSEDSNLVLVFTRTKHGANKIVEYLANYKIPSAAIHGNKSQSAREKALADFKEGKIKVLIATDIASRGIDVKGVTHVINYDLPVEAEAYVHRIGRTARAGTDGDAISFCDETERDALSRIQKLIKLKIPTEEFVAEPEAPFRPSRPQRDPRSIGQKKQNPGNQHKPRQPQEKKPQERRPERQSQERRPERQPQERKPQENQTQKPAEKRKIGFKFWKRK